MIQIYNEDCLAAIKNKPDNYYDLAVVDPPYGIGISSNPVRQAHAKKDWDNAIPTEEYFLELKRVSKEQVIWGGNYFLDYLGASQSFLVWDKKQPATFSLAMCELAWCSHRKPAKIFTKRVVGGPKKTHPTQKPVELYDFIFTHFADKGYKILDTHLGSGTIAESVKKMNHLGMDLSFDGYEIDKQYYDNAISRIFGTDIKEGLFE